MTFDEYWRKNYVRFDDSIHKHQETYELGAQSRQAELDALKKRMDEVARIVHEAHMSDGNSSVEIVYELIQEVLK